MDEGGGAVSLRGEAGWQPQRPPVRHPPAGREEPPRQQQQQQLRGSRAGGAAAQPGPCRRERWRWRTGRPLRSRRGDRRGCRLNPLLPKQSRNPKSWRQRISLRTRKLNQRGRRGLKENRQKRQTKNRQRTTCLQKMGKLKVRRPQHLMQQ